MFFSVHFKKQPQNNSLKFKISENPETIVFKDKNGKISESTFTQIYIRKLVCFLNKKNTFGNTRIQKNTKF